MEIVTAPVSEGRRKEGMANLYTEGPNLYTEDAQ